MAKGGGWGTMPGMDVSVAITVYQEAANVERLLRSLAAQTRRAAEIVICDGGSRDGTPARIEAMVAELGAALPPVRLLVEPGANISRGRNLAIRAAAGPIIAVTDAGVQLEPGWLAALTAPFAGTPTPLAVAGFFLPDVGGADAGKDEASAFLTAMAATVLPAREDIDPARFLPSSRSVAFLKSAWESAGGYPEWLDYCEDLIFDLRLNDLAPDSPTAFAWAPDAVVYFRPRESLGAFWTQYYRYARGDGKADLWRKRHAARYGVYGLLTPALIGHGLWGFAAKWLGWLGLALGIILYCARPWQRLTTLGRHLTPVQWWQAALWVPVIRATGDLAKMVGYPVGLWWRYRSRHRPELDWRRTNRRRAQ